jgi:hypothetical protein
MVFVCVREKDKEKGDLSRKMVAVMEEGKWGNEKVMNV